VVALGDDELPGGLGVGGVILVGTNTKRSDAYGYGYGYGHAEKKRTKDKKKKDRSPAASDGRLGTATPYEQDKQVEPRDVSPTGTSELTTMLAEAAPDEPQSRRARRTSSA
ncbi:MAG TPA: hypothetical protein PLU20_09510, partial [Ornithinibacter sp.]|nr:hypothetical protein [Ornithinibacter sp.]